MQAGRRHIMRGVDSALNEGSDTVNEIIVGRPINGITLNDLEYLLDDNGEIMKFRSKEHAVAFLKKQGVSDDEIYYMSFIYTNESRECQCHLCEKHGDCYIQDKFQRLPRDKTNGVGLGLCPKLK